MKRIQALNERTIEPCRVWLCTEDDFPIHAEGRDGNTAVDSFKRGHVRCGRIEYRGGHCEQGMIKCKES